MTQATFSIYDASAGSGKTYNLVKAYLKIILRSDKNDAYRNILAITFTNKAVHEMKHRIIQSLTEFCKPEPAPKMQQLLAVLARELDTQPEQIKLKAQKILKHIIHNYAAFDILTIDKFTHKVIRTFAHDLGLPNTFEVSLDTDNLILEAVDSLIAQAGEDKALTKILIDFATQKTDEDKSWDISREIFETGKLIYNENNRSEIEQLSLVGLDDFTQIKHKLRQTSVELEELNKQSAQEILHQLEGHGIDLKYFSRGVFPNHLTSIIQGQYSLKRKRFFSIEDVVLNKDTPNRAQIESLLPGIIEVLQTIYRRFERRDFYLAFLKNITPLSLLHQLNAALKSIQEEQNILSISEFNALIYQEIQNQPAPFIYERLGERYRHFFIDEFQDTSEMQWKNLIPLIDNALSSQTESGEKGTLMIVGDPKQSIYRWRGGKAEQFIGLSQHENPFSNPDKKLIWLDTNYRSAREIVDFNNSFFPFLAREFEHPDYQNLYLNKSAQKAHSSKDGFVQVRFLPEQIEAADDELMTEDKDILYCQQTFEIIQKVIDLGFLYRDIAILTRRRNQGVRLANFLTQQKIPLISSETLLIENAPEVRFLVAFLSYLDNEQNLESLAKWLLWVAKQKVPSNQVHDFVRQAMSCSNEKERAIFLSEFDISINFQEIRNKPLYEAVEVICEVFLASAGSNAYVQYFLDLIVDSAYHKQAGLADFLTHWKQNSAKYSIPSPEGNNAVRIMTIHKSKGLEFPVVIFPFAEENYSVAQRDKLWIEADEQELGIAKALVDNTQAVAGYGDSAQQTYQQRKQEELLDNINVLYVALTRAEEQLYIISRHQKTNQEGIYPNNMASYFIRFLEQKQQYAPNQNIYEFGQAHKQELSLNPPQALPMIQVVKQRLDPAVIKIARRESVLWGTPQKEAIDFGNVVHEVLSMIEQPQDIESAIDSALNRGIVKSNQAVVVREMVQRIVLHPDLADYFHPHNRVLNEQVILIPGAEAVKPDRMVVDAQGNYLLLDYKTGHRDPKHITQVQHYRSVIESLHVSVIKMALVYTHDPLEIIHL